MVDINPTKDNASYALAKTRSLELADAAFNSKAGDELDILLTLISAYEQKHYHLTQADALSALKFTMAQKNYTQKNLAQLFGKARASEILSGKRSISKQQAIILHHQWGVSAEALLSNK